MALRTYIVSNEVIGNVKYPCLLVNRKLNLVLIARNESSGVVVQSGMTGYYLGSPYEDIGSLFTKGFEVLKGKLVLEQE